MGNLYCSETEVFIENSGKDNEGRYSNGGNEPYETYCETTGKLYKACVKAHGRCTGKMYVDRKNGKTVQTGWVFVKKAAQGRRDLPGLIETWVSVWVVPPKKVVSFEGEVLPTFSNKKGSVR